MLTYNRINTITTGLSLILCLPLLWFWFVRDEKHEDGIAIANYADTYNRIPYRNYALFNIGDNRQLNWVAIESAKGLAHTINTQNDTSVGIFFQFKNCKYKDVIDVINIAVKEKLPYDYDYNKLVIYKKIGPENRLMTFEWPTKETEPYL